MSRDVVGCRVICAPRGAGVSTVSHQVEHYARMTVAKGCRLRVYLSTDGGTTG